MYQNVTDDLVNLINNLTKLFTLSLPRLNTLIAPIRTVHELPHLQIQQSTWHTQNPTTGICEGDVCFQRGINNIQVTFQASEDYREKCGSGVVSHHR
jgi:hypothetical protein